MISKKVKVNLGRGYRLKKASGVLNFNRLYEEMREWVDKYRYDFTEKKFDSKDRDKGKEIEVVWIGEREITDYIKYNFQIVFFLTKIWPASKDLVKGNIVVTLSADVELDYKEKWRHNTFSNFLFKIYNNYIVKDEIKKHSKKLYNEMMDFHDRAKEVLEFYR